GQQVSKGSSTWLLAAAVSGLKNRSKRRGQRPASRANKQTCASMLITSAGWYTHVLASAAGQGTRTPARVDDMSAADLMKRVEQIYQERLRSELERTHRDDFVAIEPDSGEYFLGRTLSEAAAAARAADPN